MVCNRLWKWYIYKLSSSVLRLSSIILRLSSSVLLIIQHCLTYCLALSYLLSSGMLPVVQWYVTCCLALSYLLSSGMLPIVQWYVTYCLVLSKQPLQATQLSYLPQYVTDLSNRLQEWYVVKYVYAAKLFKIALYTLYTYEI